MERKQNKDTWIKFPVSSDTRQRLREQENLEKMPLVKLAPTIIERGLERKFNEQDLLEKVCTELIGLFDSNSSDIRVGRSGELLSLSWNSGKERRIVYYDPCTKEFRNNLKTDISSEHAS